MNFGFRNSNFGRVGLMIADYQFPISYWRLNNAHSRGMRSSVPPRGSGWVIVVLPFATGLNIWRTIAVVETINRASLVSVQPGAVGTEGYEVSERSVSIVPHDPSDCTHACSGINLVSINQSPTGTTTRYLLSCMQKTGADYPPATAWWC